MLATFHLLWFFRFYNFSASVLDIRLDQVIQACRYKIHSWVYIILLPHGWISEFFFLAYYLSSLLLLCDAIFSYSSFIFFYFSILFHSIHFFLDTSLETNMTTLKKYLQFIWSWSDRACCALAFVERAFRGQPFIAQTNRQIQKGFSITSIYSIWHVCYKAIETSIIKNRRKCCYSQEKQRI